MGLSASSTSYPLPSTPSTTSSRPSDPASLALSSSPITSPPTGPSPSSPSRRGGRPECAVCVCGRADADRVRRLPCRHVFHGECLDGWRTLQPSVPLPAGRIGAARRRRPPDRGGARLLALPLLIRRWRPIRATATVVMMFAGCGLFSNILS